MDATAPTDGALPPPDAPSKPARDAGIDGPPDADLLVGETPGCGCRANPRGASGVIGWAALALLGLRRRRRLQG
jgi:MYXO-CTERM domain-containing protein